MKRTIILVCLQMLGFTILNEVISQEFTKSHSVGYSVGEGQGFSYIFGRTLDDSVVNSGDFGFGAVVNFRIQDIEDGDRSELILAGRVSYHPYIFESERLDAYAFFALGVGFEDINNDPNYVGPRVAEQTQYTAWGGGAGIRYNLFWRFGVFAEGSYGLGAITLGLYLKAY